MCPTRPGSNPARPSGSRSRSPTGVSPGRFRSRSDGMRPDAARRMLPLVVLLCAATAPLTLRGQVQFVAHGLGSVSIDVDDQDATSGAGFGFMTGAGIRLRNLEFGGEYGQHGLGD